MKLLLSFCLFIICFESNCYSQNIQLDTIFYDKEWKGLPNSAFATYYRIYETNAELTSPKRFRDFYITGEIYCDGKYISIDKDDDSKSVFDGEWIQYYKSGKIAQKGFRNKGVEEGEYTSYYENGLVKMHTFMKNGKQNGIKTFFNVVGDTCTQIEMLDGNPKYDYYIISNKEGYRCKIHINDHKPIYESPEPDELKEEYYDGNPWQYYTKNGITVAMNNTILKDYGKWFQISLEIINNSFFPFEFNPDKIISFSQENDQVIALDVWSSDRYIGKVKKVQNRHMFWAAFAEGLAASRTHDNSIAAYQTQILSNYILSNYENTFFKERTSKQIGYLKKTTIYPGECISGYINIKYEKIHSMIVSVDINGAKYEYTWNIPKK